MSDSETSDRLTHFDDQGRARMVDVGEKPVTARSARASGAVKMQPETWRRIQDRRIEKGDVLEVARLAGIMAAKNTAQWIPLCHPLPVDSIEVHFRFESPDRIHIESQVRVQGRTGVEMEALVAVSAAGLTIYDMCKAIDRGMQIDAVRLEEKIGGKSGHYHREQSQS